MTRRTKRDPYTRRLVRLPDQPLSAALLDLAAPLLDAVGPSSEAQRQTIDLAIIVWNCHVMAGPHWGEPRVLAEVRRAMADHPRPPSRAEAFEALASRWREKFALDPRRVGDWSFEVTADGRRELVCAMTLPEGVEAIQPPPPEKRIAIGGRYLDEVLVRLTANSYRSFPVEQHRGEVSPDGAVVIQTKTPVVIELFAAGVLKPRGAGAVDLLVGGRALGPLPLREVRQRSDIDFHERVELVFQREGDAPRQGTSGQRG